METLKEDPGEGRAVAGPALLHVNEANQQISNTVYELQNSYRFSSIIQIPQESPLGPTQCGNIQEREFWET